MSQIPKDIKSKYNHDNKFLWVDAQLEKFMVRQKELEDEITNLTGKIKNDMDYIRMLESSVGELKEKHKVIKQLQDDLVTCNKHFQKQRKHLLELEMENAELKDMVLDLGGKY